MRSTLRSALANAAFAAALSAAVFLTATSIRATDPDVAPSSDRQTGAVMERAAIQAFEQRVADYVALHRRLEKSVPPLQVTNDMDTVWATVAAFGERIRMARPDAGQGNVFTADVARVFRARIAGCLTPEEMDIILTEGDEDDPIAVPPLVANAPWPAGVPFNFVPPSLIAALPPLPPELQYRIIGRSLVLWDHHANVIVDFLSAAFTT
jgi:hypothetical protein